MNALYQFDLHPDLHEPLLIVSLDGWVDAGGAGDLTRQALLSQLNFDTIATFDTDRLLDYRARRPIMHLVDGVNTKLTWPSIDLAAGTDANDHDVLLLRGPEPDHEWKGFSRAIVDLAHELDVRLILGFGAYPAAVPHTRPARLSSTATTSELAERYHFANSTLDVPAGVSAAIERLGADEGIPGLGIWAQVPHYAAGMPYPAAAAALLDAFGEIGHLALDSTDLKEEGLVTRAHLDGLVGNNPEHEQMLRQLEAHDDAMTQANATEIPTGDELAEELQAFLRESDDPKGDQP